MKSVDMNGGPVLGDTKVKHTPKDMLTLYVAPNVEDGARPTT